MSGDTNFHIIMPVDLRTHATVTAKKLRLSTSTFVRIAIDEKIKRFEEEEQQREAAKRSRKKQSANTSGLARGLSAANRTMPNNKPLTESFADKMADSERANTSSYADEKLYAELARHIADAGEDPAEIRRRAVKAVDSIRRARPLTCPLENEILIKLEDHIAKIRLDEITPTRNDPYAKLVGVMLDVKKIRSLGNVDEPAAEVPTETE